MKPSGIVVSAYGYYAVSPELVFWWVRFIQPVGVNKQGIKLAWEQNIEGLLGWPTNRDICLIVLQDPGSIKPGWV